MNKVSLAIMAKILLLYEESIEDEDSFVAFHPIAQPLSPRDLTFQATGGSGISPQEALRAEADFAFLTNATVKVDRIWSPEDRFLWDEYSAVLKADVFESELSAAQQQELQAARNLLYQVRKVTDVITGVEQEEIIRTPIYEAYSQHEDAYYQAKERLIAEQLTAENSGDPALQQAWLAQKPALEKEVQSALTDWLVKGHKDQVEQAIADIDRLTGQGPQLAWHQAKDRLEQSLRNDSIVSRQFYQTAYFPYGFHQSDAQRGWTRLELTGGEIESLSQKALEIMPELASQAVVEDQFQADVEIAKLSVELARIGLFRPWWDSELVHSRYWRWNDGRDLLSDGGDPPKGTCPAYTTGLIFARSLDVELKPKSQKNQAAIAKLQSGHLMTLGPMLLKQVPSSAQPEGVTQLQSATLDPNQTKLLRSMQVEAVTGQSGQVDMMQRVDNSPLYLKQLSVIQQSPQLSVGISTPVQRVQPNVVVATQGNHVKAQVNQVSATARVVRDHRTQLKQLPKQFENIKINPPFVNKGPIHTIPIQPRPTVPSSSGYRGFVYERSADNSIGAKLSDVQIVFAKENDKSGTRVAKSSTSGFYQVDLSPGRYYVSATRSGYQPYSTGGGFFVVSGNGYQTGNIFLRKGGGSQVPPPRPASPKGGYRGFVYELLENGGPGRKLGSCSVTFTRQDKGLTKTAQTDASGSYQVSLPPGRYVVTANLFGYKDYSTGSGFFELRGDEFQSGDIYLERDRTEQQIEDSFAGLQLIACICQKLPKLPNPDPNFPWGDA